MQSVHAKFVKISILVLMGSILFSCGGLKNGKDIVFRQIDRGQELREAFVAYQEQNYELAAKHYASVLTHNQDDAVVAYNLACCYALQGDAENAARFVTHAFANGFRNLEIFKKDTDFDPVRDDPKFKGVEQEIFNNFKSIGSLKYVKATSYLPYRIRYPHDYEKSESYPLLIGLHGNGGNADGFVSLYDQLDDPQIIYATPEGQYPLSMNIGPQWHTRTWAIPRVDKKGWKSADTLVAEHVLNTIADIKATHKISDVYLMGFSQGAVYAYTIGMQNSDEIEGVIGFSGYLMEVDGKHSILSKSDLDQGKELRLYIAHGIDDAAITVEEARKLKASFEALGFDLTYEEFEGRHGVKADIFNKAVTWMQL